MKKLLSFILALAILTLSGCNNKAEPTNAKQYNYISFDKTDWGMTPQQTLKALNVKFEDVEIEPMLTVPESKSYTIGYNVNILKPLKINKLDVKLTLCFRNLMISGKTYDSLGLTDIYVTYPDVNDELYNLISSNYKNEFKDKFKTKSGGTKNYASTTYECLPKELVVKIEDFYNRRNRTFHDESNHIFGETSSVWFDHKAIDNTISVKLSYHGHVVALAKYLSSNDDPAIEYMKKLGAMRQK